MDWMRGYLADGGYTYGFYAETTPARLRLAGLLHGQLLPKRQFRYLDAGCGQGVNLIMAAACHPDSEFVGIDFMPEHIAHGRRLAAEAGLKNVTFIEGDFIELAKNTAALGEFDYAVCHGISTWIGPDVKAGLFKLIGQVLKPGGVFYNSYNTLPGWGTMSAFQKMVLMNNKTMPARKAIEATLAQFEALEQAKSRVFSTLPTLSQRLKNLRGKDPSYLVQEYNNAYWNPVYVTDMISDMAAVKLQWLGTATLTEIPEATLPEGLRTAMQAAPTVAMREQLRDIGLDQSFRRDLYIKGQVAHWRDELASARRELRVAVNELAKLPEGEADFVFQGGAVSPQGNRTYYLSILDHVRAAPSGLSLGELQAHYPKLSMDTLLMSLSMLIHSGFLYYCPVEDQAVTSRTLTQAMVSAVLKGAPYKAVLMPRNTTVMGLNDTDWALLDACLRELPQPKWADHLLACLKARGVSLAKKGVAVTDPAEVDTMVKRLVTEFAEGKLRQLKAFGAV